MTDSETVEQIAIVGMAGRFPGAADVDHFWANLCHGVESIRPFSEAELLAAGADISNPNFVNSGAVMDGYDSFDAAFFGMSRREAELTDPQHRAFLESAWAAIESAGYDPATYKGHIGVFGGVAANTYFRNNLMAHPDLLAKTGDYPLLLATEREYAITRTAYKIGLTGPAISVNTACSTSAVAVHLAIGSLLSGESDLALAGGARVRVPASGYIYQEDGILSSDGHCRTFDANARGTVAASGVAIVALKRLTDAMRDRDTVYAVIAGSAVNNDGAAKIGYTAPSISGQAAVIEEALAVADIDAGSIEMVEAHGTGTSLGDPIEVAALTQVYRLYTDRRQYCAIGSLKSNVGHLDAGAGVAGIIKAALSLHHEQIPPSINFESPNPHIDFASSPFFVNTELRPWKRSDGPRRAAVSSFGLGGTNAHVLLEEAPPPAEGSPTPSGPQLLVLSAKTASALQRRSRQLAEHLGSKAEAQLADTSWTLGVGRARMMHRRAVVAIDRDDAIGLLQGEETRSAVERETTSEGTRVAFLFPGQGAQHPGMASALYRSEPVFKAALDECADILRPIIGQDLLRLMYPGDDADADEAARALGVADIAQPTTFAVQYSLARLWMSWGIEPAAMIGHSLGEYAAACLSGVLSLEDALQLVAVRGRLMQDLGGGGMLAVVAEPETVSPLLDEHTSLAAINAPTQVVASGPAESIDALGARLSADGIEAQRLPIRLAAHSSMMDPMVGPLGSLVEGMSRGRLAIPIVSTATGDWVTDEQISDPVYWASHVRRTVRFSDAVGRLLEQSDMALLEVGPGQTLAPLVRQHPSATPDRAIFASLPHSRQKVDDQIFALRTLGGLWSAGVDVDWRAVQKGARRRVPLPTYPFEHERFWIEGAVGTQQEPASPVATEPPSESDLTPVPAALAVDDDEGSLLASNRKDRIAAGLTTIISDLSGIEISALDPTATFVDLGFDSLFLTQANSQFRKQFGVRITFRQLFEEAPSIEALAAFIDDRIAPDESLPNPQGPPQLSSSAAPTTSVGAVVKSQSTDPVGAPAGRLEQLMSEQLRLIEQQLELLRAERTFPNSVAAPSVPSPARPSSSPSKTHHLAPSGQGAASVAEGHAVSAEQRAAIDELVSRANARTPKSKELAGLWRPRLADNRTIVGFDKAWKELVYQIVSVRSAGSRIWDVDGNEYIDTALGFGTNLFGHSPDFVVAAVREQFERGYEVGVQNHLLGEVTELACLATGNDRMAYTTSGGEAVETAIRVARTVTGRDKVAYFTDDIHGRSDIVLGRSVELGGEPRTLPMVAGVPQSVVDQAFVLAYGTDRALEIIRAHASELALVLVEPVRTRNPDLQPVQFLRELRRMADEEGFLLVFDEVVTGFRAHMGGVQAMFGIHADITTYGKVLGGGLPIGVVAGAAEYIDVLDGGPWLFGDDSFPEADITASGGTFIKHPLTLAAAKAVLTHLKECGPTLQADLNDRTAAAVAAINSAYDRDGLPIHVEHFSSFFRPTFTDSSRFAGLFQHYLREQGVNTNPPSPSFLSTAHSEADVEAVVRAYIEAGRAMGREGLLQRTGAPARGHAASSPPAPTATPVPVLPNVARFLGERNTPDPGHWNLGVLLRPERALDPDLLQEVVKQLVARHDALRLRFIHGNNGTASSIAAAAEPLPVMYFDISGQPREEQRASLERHAGEIQRSLNLEHGPVIRIAVFNFGDGEQRLLVIVHHFVMDAVSWRPFWEDFDSIWRDLEGGRPVALSPPSTSFEEWAHALKTRSDSDALRREIPDWLGLPWDRVQPIPLDYNGQEGSNTNSSAREVILEFSEAETSTMLHETPGVVHKTDMLMTVLAEVIAGWTASDTAMFDVMGHGRDEDNFDDVDLFGTVGFFISYTPMVLDVSSQSGAPRVLSEQIQPILRRGLSFDLLRCMTSDASVRETFGSLPRAQILFNHLGKRDEIDAVPFGSMFSQASESIGRTHSPSGIRYYPLAISSEVWRDQLRLKFVYSRNLHRRSTIEGIAEGFRDRLMAHIRLAREGP